MVSGAECYSRFLHGDKKAIEDVIREYIAICDSLNLSALVEAHDEAEVESASKAGARIIGVNNRNLKDFTVDTGNSKKLRSLIPENVIFVSESGVRSAEDDYANWLTILFFLLPRAESKQLRMWKF